MQSLSLGNSSAKFSSLGLISCPNSSPTLPEASWMSQQPSNKTHLNQISSFPHLNPISYPQTYEKVETSRFLKLQGRQYTQSVCRTEIRKRPGENSINAHSEMYLDKILMKSQNQDLCRFVFQILSRQHLTRPHEVCAEWMNKCSKYHVCLSASMCWRGKAIHKRIWRQRTPGNLLMSMKRIFVNGMLPN